MRLSQPFYRLPVRFDVERLRAEVSALPASAWAKHPNHIEGNSSVRLISVDGGENDDVNGVMQATPHLEQSPYLRQVLASFGVVWSRSRLLRLAPGASVPEHADINYHWFNRVRLHIPVITRPEVKFQCGGQTVHMGSGEAWLFDNWRLHSVENPTAHERIHLVADTSGSAEFWKFVSLGGLPDTSVRELPFNPGQDLHPLTEHTVLAPVMTPAEVDFLILDLRSELVANSNGAEAQARLARYHALLDALCRDWRQFYALHGERREGWPAFAQLRDSVREASVVIAEGLAMRTNGIAAHKVLEGRVLRPMLGPAPAAATANAARGRSRLHQPVFIIAAPRSGSTLLFETLAVSPQWFTLGGEGHALIEGIPELQPGAPGVDSNRLEARQATDAVAERIVNEVLRDMRNSRGESPPPTGPLRFLEKTPKNALRIPFLERVFPDAKFVVLWRDPRDSLSSIMEAWRSGQWKTYNGLSGFDGPWSLLLPPGWRGMNGRPLEEIAAFQWDTTHRVVLEDLARLSRDRWTAVSYAQLTGDTTATIRRLCAFTGIEFDATLAEHVSRPLPPSRYTHTAPAPDKWRRNQAEIERVLPTLEATWKQLNALG
ncbi:MAG: sulfotransferase [Gammaproteobacteria bacterium]